MIVVFADDSAEDRQHLLDTIEEGFRPEDDELAERFDKQLVSVSKALGLTDSEDESGEDPKEILIEASGNISFLVTDKLESLTSVVEELNVNDRHVLVLLDLMWGNDPSYPQIKALKKQKEGKWPVIVLSKFKEEDRVAAAYKHQANAYLQKETELDLNVRSLRSVVGVWKDRFEMVA